MNKIMKKKKKSSLLAAQARAGYLFTGTVIIGILFIYIPMFIRAISFSFNDILINQNGYSLTGVGIKYYKQMIFEDPVLLAALVKSIGNMLTDLICIIIFSIFIAVVLNQKFKGRTFARVVFFLPVVALSGVIAAVQYSGASTSSMTIDAGFISTLSFDDVKTILLKTSLDKRLVEFVSTAVDKIYSIITSSGVQILIFLGGIQSIPYSLHEAAYTEGCSGWEFFWKITFPYLSPYILVNSLYTIIDSFTSSSNVFMSQVVDMSKTISKFSYSSAASMLYFAVIAVIIVIVIGIMNKSVSYLD